MTPTQRSRRVVAHSVHPQASRHVVETNRALARWLAQILGLTFAGSHDPTRRPVPDDIYLLPTQTLVGPTAGRPGAGGFMGRVRRARLYLHQGHHPWSVE